MPVRDLPCLTETFPSYCTKWRRWDGRARALPFESRALSFGIRSPGRTLPYGSMFALCYREFQQDRDGRSRALSFGYRALSRSIRWLDRTLPCEGKQFPSGCMKLRRRGDGVRAYLFFSREFFSPKGARS